MATTNSAFGLYRTRQELNQAIQSLKKNGIDPSDISFLLPMGHGDKDFPYKQRTQAPLMALLGAVLGGGALSIVGLMIGSGVIPLPGVGLGPFSFSVQVIAVVVTAVLGVLVGAGAGTLIGIGTPQTVTTRYGNYLKEGGYLLSVHAEKNEELRTARDLIENSGGQDIQFLNEAQGWSEVTTEESKNNQELNY